MNASLFEPGRNCLRVARAERVALLVDGAAYFKAFAEAALRAERSIVIVGWDFHSRTRLHHGIAGIPESLGDFLNYLVQRRRGLYVRVLIWDYPVIFAKGRELSPIYGFGWRPRRRVRVRYDDCYPLGASQHQKIVTIDGALAFCGGLDLTRSRWDTCEHRPNDPRRVNFGETKPYPPFHDTMMALDGAAARALEEVARERWRCATGKHIRASGELAAPSSESRQHGLWNKTRNRMRDTLRNRMRRSVRNDPWPDELPVSISNVDVAVARTLAPTGDEPAVKEIEALYLDMIAAARRSIYIENQYFTSNSLGAALAARLAEPDGPEVIAVMRLSTAGWLEAPTMGTLRTVLLRKLRDADAQGRFHPYYPHIPGLAAGENCDLHSKLMIVDDQSLLIGSANFCNRSMGLDTECNVAIEARADERIAASIRGFRARLLAEHLNVTEEAVESAHRKTGSLGGAIAALTGDGRTLKPYAQLDEPSEAMLAIAESVADPETPVALDKLVALFEPDMNGHGARRRWPLWMLLAVILAAFAAMWRYTPLAAWADAERVVGWAREFSVQVGAPLLVMAAYTPASLVLFPRPLITLFAVVAFGAAWGFVYAFSGILLAALVTYALGLRLNRGAVRRIAGNRLNRLSRIMRERGVLAVTAVRLVPLAPFAVVNVVAGAIRIKLWHFMIGSALGILPGTLVATVFGDQLAAGLRDPRSINLWLIVAAIVVLVAATWAVRRWLFGTESRGR